MKNMMILLLTILLLNACSVNNPNTPSQNSRLNRLTSATKKESGSVQKALDSWLNEEWIPKVEKDKKIKAIDSDKERDFRLQEYVDKAVVYFKESNTTAKESHLKKLNSLPVIGE